MALNVSQLQNAFADIMGPNRPKSPAEAADRWSAAYASYAQAAQTPLGDMISSVSGPQSIMKSLLLAAFSSPIGPAPATAAAIGSAFTAFWMAPPIVFTGPPISAIVTAAPGGPILQSGLLSLWPSLALSRAPVDVTAAQHAALFHAATMTVLVTHILPPPAPPVISPIL